MQFGGGNFLRAFVDWMVQVLNQETDFNGGIAIVKPTEIGDYSNLKAQDGLFHVVLDGIKNGKLISEKVLITAVQEIVNIHTEWETYLDLARNPNLRFIVSNTTEAGIRFNEKDVLTANPVKEFPAKLTLWLYRRFEHFNGDVSKGCIVLPCELIEDNGAALKKTVLQYAHHWGLTEDFVVWLGTANYFCSTLVDRIVSGYPTDRAEAIQAELGFTDSLLVAGEQYHSWVIQRAGPVSDELPFSKTGLNVSFVDDLAPYREMKVRVLNGAHTSMVAVGYLAGLRLVKEVMDDATVCGFVESLLLEETCPTMNFPEEVKQRFVKDVMDRFRNPTLKHQLISISLNSTSKFVSRLLPTLKDFQKSRGELPKRIVFGLTCLIRFYKGEFNGIEIPVNDNPEVLAFFKVNWSRLVTDEINIETMVGIILGNSSIWGEDLNGIPELTRTVSDQLNALDKNGVAHVLKIL